MRAAHLAVLVLVAACGGAKSPPPESAAPPVGTPAPAAPDSLAVETPGVPPTADSAKRSPGPARPEAPLRDSAFGPRGAVDSTGKVVPIKRP
jgi:hypothetical protein